MVETTTFSVSVGIVSALESVPLVSTLNVQGKVSLADASLEADTRISTRTVWLSNVLSFVFGNSPVERRKLFQILTHIIQHYITKSQPCWSVTTLFTKPRDFLPPAAVRDRFPIHGLRIFTMTQELCQSKPWNSSDIDLVNSAVMV